MGFVIEVAQICEENNLWVLADEAYFDVLYGMYQM